MIYVWVAKFSFCISFWKRLFIDDFYPAEAGIKMKKSCKEDWNVSFVLKAIMFKRMHSVTNANSKSLP